MLSYVENYIIRLIKANSCKCQNHKFKISDVVMIKSMQDELINDVKDGKIKIQCYYDNHNIGHITYKQNIGQIGLIIVDDAYRRHGLGRHLLVQAIKDIKKTGYKEVWAVTNLDHSFWSNISFQNSSNNEPKKFIWREPVHNSVTSPGYYMDLSNLRL